MSRSSPRRRSSRPCSSPPPIFSTAHRHQPHLLSKFPHSSRQLLDRRSRRSFSRAQLLRMFLLEREYATHRLRHPPRECPVELHVSSQRFLGLQNVVLPMADETQISA